MIPENTLLDKSGAGVLLQVLFRTYKFPYILKYDKNDYYQSLRDRYDYELLKAGLYIEKEVSVEDSSMIYLKIIAPFDCLCACAENNELLKQVHV